MNLFLDENTIELTCFNKLKCVVFNLYDLISMFLPNPDYIKIMHSCCWESQAYKYLAYYLDGGILMLNKSTFDYSQFL